MRQYFTLLKYGNNSDLFLQSKSTYLCSHFALFLLTIRVALFCIKVNATEMCKTSNAHKQAAISVEAKFTNHYSSTTA